MRKNRHTAHTGKGAKTAPAALALALTGCLIMVAALGYLALNLDRADTLSPVCIPFAAAGIVLAFTGVAIMLVSRRTKR